MKNCIHSFVTFFGKTDGDYFNFNYTGYIFLFKNQPDITFFTYKKHNGQDTRYSESTIFDELNKEDNDGIFPCKRCSRFVFNVYDIKMIITYHKIAGLQGIVEYVEQVGLVREFKI